jgi:hypothetical protein
MEEAVLERVKLLMMMVGCSLVACGSAPGTDVGQADGESADELLAPRGGHFFTQTLARGETLIRDLAADGSSVYYVSAAASDPSQPLNTVGRAVAVSKLGGRPRVLDAALQGGGSIAVNDRSVFFTATVDAVNGRQPAIFSQPKFGGRKSRFAPSFSSGISDNSDPPLLLADDLQVYATDGIEELYRIPIATQSPVALLQSADHVSIAVSPREVFLAEGRNCSSFIAEIRKNAPANTVSEGAPSPFASFIDDENVVCVVWSMAVSGSTLYWNSLFGGLFSAHLNGAPALPDTPKLLLASDPSDGDSLNGMRYIAVVPPNLYFTTADGTLKSIPEQGGAVTTVVASDVNPDVRIGADNDSVYWVSSAADQLRRTRVR